MRLPRRRGDAFTYQRALRCKSVSVLALSKRIGPVNITCCAALALFGLTHGMTKGSRKGMVESLCHEPHGDV
ncbi:hypothetical protein BN1723_014825 [Verticillium longisporum]|uniref:Uncharacterized protein n=1 Tax=Verticillium longisporum TaxID=100787 RepID=A0A0G4MIK0_VERLO|nr:hypothetical protein BN1723_014825 [Verticillium longisporum]